jgi:hypothetical protein
MIEAHGLVKRYGSTMAAGTLLRHPAAAIASMIAVLFVLPELRPPGSRRSVIPGSTAIRRPRRLDNRRTNPGWTNANEVQDLDNLIKPALDAMEGIFGLADMERTSASRRRQGGSPRGRQAPAPARRTSRRDHRCAGNCSGLTARHGNPTASGPTGNLSRTPGGAYIRFCRQECSQVLLSEGPEPLAWKHRSVPRGSLTGRPSRRSVPGECRHARRACRSLRSCAPGSIAGTWARAPRPCVSRAG